MIPLITIEGPTASGKSELALKLAQELGSQIISADSRQVYRQMDIGTAKPSSDDLKRVKHHLIDIIDPDESYNVGRFCAEAGMIIKDLEAKGIVPIVCGGTGLYVSGLLGGIFPQIDISPSIRTSLHQRLTDVGLDALYQELTKVDPPFANGISSRDKQRVLRGLEVFEATGIPITEHWQRQTPKKIYKTYRVLIDPPRDILYERINRRIGVMLEKGLLNEIQGLFDRGYDESAPGLYSLGYKEFIPFLKEGVSLEECASQAAQHTRNYAKRQCTWYRKYKFDLTLPSNEFILSEMLDKIRICI